MLGWEVDSGKAVSESSNCMILGVQADVVDESRCLTLSIGTEKVDK